MGKVVKSEWLLDRSIMKLIEFIDEIGCGSVRKSEIEVDSWVSHLHVNVNSLEQIQ